MKVVCTSDYKPQLSLGHARTHYHLLHCLAGQGLRGKSIPELMSSHPRVHPGTWQEQAAILRPTLRIVKVTATPLSSLVHSKAQEYKLCKALELPCSVVFQAAKFYVS